jgi:hypothetical protein
LTELFLCAHQADELPGNVSDILVKMIASTLISICLGLVSWVYKGLLAVEHMAKLFPDEADCEA